MVFTCRHYCSFCKIALKTKKGWVSHLLCPDHQDEAREEFVSWDLQTKERVLVSFGKFSVATETVMGSFVEPDGRSNLTGFVWNENRDRVGLLLFESREKVDEILSGLGEGFQMRIGTYQLLQLKKATDYLDIEWDEHFVADFRKELKPNFMSKLDNSDGSSSDSEEMELDEASLDRKTIKVEPDEMALSNLSFQLYFICRQMEIEDEAYRMTLSIQEKFQRVLTKHYKRGHVFMFPHSLLRLRTQGAKELLFYVDVDGVLGGERGGEIGIFVKKRSKELAKNFSSNVARKILTGISRVGKIKREFVNGSALHFADTATKSKFAVVTDPLFAAEAQTCRLLNYLLDFDPRARPFRTLIFYWAEQNGVNIQGSSRNKMRSYLSHPFAPEPAGLEWMIIFFLCRKRIVPTPREILMGRQNNHHDVWYAVRKLQIDIGFRMDYLFAEVWRAASVMNCPVLGTNQFVIHLARLSEEFFRFYGQLGSSSQQHWVLNTKDGELLRKEDLLGSGEYRTRLTSEEQARLRNYKGKLTKRHVQLNNLVNGRFTILHPLILEWTIPCDKDNFFGKICGEMLATAYILEHWLPVLDGNRMDEDNDQKTTLLTLYRKVTLEEVRPFSVG